MPKVLVVDDAAFMRMRCKKLLVDQGYEVTEARTKGPRPAVFSTREVGRMAEMEHGRWNLERIRSGWKPGPRDPEAKTSPYIVSWDELPDDIKEYDREAVRGFPAVLAEAGMTVSVRKA